MSKAGGRPSRDPATPDSGTSRPAQHERRRSRPIPESIRTLLIEMPSWVGDCVMATPVLRAARQALPESRIVGLVRPGLDALMTPMPHLDHMVAVRSKGALGVWRSARAIRRQSPEALLLLPNSFRSGLAARLSRTKRRIGYARDGRGFLLTHGLRVNRDHRPIPTVSYYSALAKYAFGLDRIDHRPELHVSREQHAEADRLLDGCGRFVLLNPGGVRPEKRWPAERFAAVADELATKHGLAIVVNGAPGERELVESITERMTAAAVNLVERGVTLASLKAVIARASLVITNDTGPRHIAAALGTPAVALFGPTDHRWTTLEAPDERIIVAEPFLPETMIADDHAAACRIDRITVGDVVNHAEALIRTSP